VDGSGSVGWEESKVMEKVAGVFSGFLDAPNVSVDNIVLGFF
jgi:hypothetical protein